MYYFSSQPLMFPTSLAPYIIQSKLNKMQRKILHVSKGWFQKKKLIEFSIKLAGWVLDAPGWGYQEGVMWAT